MATPTGATNKKISRRRNENLMATKKAPSLSVDNVMAVLKKLPWRNVSSSILCIPYSKLNAIKRECLTDEEILRVCVQYWLLRDPYASWRRIIWQLDLHGHRAIADTIRSDAKKLTDPTLTLSRVLVAMETVSTDDLYSILYISSHLMEEMKRRYSDYRKQSIIYWLKASPYASWSYLGGRCLGGRCLYYNEKQALDIIKRFIKTNRDTSLTLTNLTQIMEDVKMDKYDVCDYLDIPMSVYDDISKQHSDVSQKNKALCEWYLNNHPSPSWKHIAYVLYRNEDHDVLDVLRSHYLKDTSLRSWRMWRWRSMIPRHS